MTFGFNNFGINCGFGGGMPPLLPGSTIKVNQTRTGGVSIFSKNPGTTTTNIKIQNGPSGFWGFAVGLMNSIGLGNFGYNMGNYNMGSYNMGGYNYGMGNYGYGMNNFNYGMNNFGYDMNNYDSNQVKALSEQMHQAGMKSVHNTPAPKADSGDEPTT